MYEWLVYGYGKQFNEFKFQKLKIEIRFLITTRKAIRAALGISKTVDSLFHSTVAVDTFH